MSKIFFYFFKTVLNREKQYFRAIFIIFVFLVTILSSVFFISFSIKNIINLTIKNQYDIIVQNINSGKVVDVPLEWIDELVEIYGIKSITPRVYGRYYYEPKEHYFSIIGIDFYDPNSLKLIKDLDINLDNFFDKNYMLIGQGVAKFLDEYRYDRYYNFRPPDRSIIKVYRYKTLPPQTNILSLDTVLLDINLAKKF